MTDTITTFAAGWFVPGNRDVVICKGKRYFNHSGNVWLRELTASLIREYTAATSKLDKSLIISDVIEYVRQVGSFVQPSPTGKGWVYADEHLCREKTSASFRDALRQRKPSCWSFSKRAMHEKKQHFTAPTQAVTLHDAAYSKLRCVTPPSDCMETLVAPHCYSQGSARDVFQPLSLDIESFPCFEDIQEILVPALQENTFEADFDLFAWIEGTIP